MLPSRELDLGDPNSESKQVVKESRYRINSYFGLEDERIYKGRGQLQPAACYERYSKLHLETHSSVLPRLIQVVGDFKSILIACSTVYLVTIFNINGLWRTDLNMVAKLAILYSIFYPLFSVCYARCSAVLYYTTSVHYCTISYHRHILTLGLYCVLCCAFDL
jgi:hypothetical protein